MVSLLLVIKDAEIEEIDGRLGEHLATLLADTHGLLRVVGLNGDDEQLLPGLFVVGLHLGDELVLIAGLLRLVLHHQ